MSDVQFFETRMGKQYYDVTLPELVRQIARLNDLLALGIEQMEQNAKAQDYSVKSNGKPRSSGRTERK